MADTNLETIKCTVGKWYYKRMILMALMLSAFGGWFLYDGVIGYPKKNRIAVAEEAFLAGQNGASWEEHAEDNKKLTEMKPDDAQLAEWKDSHAAGSAKMPWADYAAKNKLDESPDEGSDEAAIASAFTAGGREGAKWEDYAPAQNIPVDSKERKHVERRRAFEAAGQKREWAGYALTKGWSSRDNKYHGPGDIREQLVIAAVCCIGGGIALFFLLTNRNRTISADGEAYTTEKGERIPFTSVRRIDKRKWDNKGLAYVFHGDGEKKAVLDDLKYIGADKILSRIMDNAPETTEIVERVSHDEEAAESALKNDSDSSDSIENTQDETASEEPANAEKN